jgi:TPP-dependent pyruvate/acetoin dehydrogenase alpha subunit
MNMAALWNLPVIYACENNGYSEYTKTEEIAAGSIMAGPRPSASRPPGRRAGRAGRQRPDGASWWSAARKGEGPFFMELMTYRYHGHHVGDINREYYRSKDEEKDWKENKDPIIRFARLPRPRKASRRRRNSRR